MTRTALVVGASGAIGAAVKTVLGESGWHCLGSSSRSAGDVQIDLAKPDGFRTAVESLPPLDGVVFCAGRQPSRSLADMTRSHAEDMVAVHVVGPMLLLQALQSHLKDGSGVVFLSSVAAYRGSYDPSYAAANGAVAAMTRSLARGLAPRVRVNAIAPSLVADSPVFAQMTPDFRENHLRTTPLGRLATPRDCAEAVLFLLTHRHMTGSVLHLNGGQYFG